MTVFLIIVAVYLLSIVAVYYVARFMYMTQNPKGPIPPIYWPVPLVNTFLAIAGFFFCAKDIPVLGETYWNTVWENEKLNKKNKSAKSTI